MSFINQVSAAMNLNSYANIFSSVSKPEFLFSGVLLVFLLLYGISLGRTRALISLLGIYIAYVFNETFIYFSQLYSWIPIKNVNIVRTGIFIIMYAIIFFVLNRSLAKTRLTLREASLVSVFLISILQLGLLLSITANLLKGDIATHLPVIFLTYFGTKAALFYWSVAPLAALLFMRKKD